MTAVVALVLFASAGPASAHEQRKVGAYQLTVGWLKEPTYAGFQNAVQLFLKDSAGKPIDDIGDPPTLRVTVMSAGQTSDPLPLEASFDPDTGLGTHGEFDAAIIPTTPGSYTFHFTGTLKGQTIDQSFASSDSTFDVVKEPTAIEFPAKTPSAQQLAASVGRLGPRVDHAASLAASGRSTAASAHDKASSAWTLALVALIVGIVLGGLGTALGVAARRRPPDVTGGERAR